MKPELVSKLLRDFADNIDAGNTYATEEELMEICDTLGYITNPETKMSAYQAADYIGVSRKTFDYHVREGHIPPHAPQAGFKENFWYRRDLAKFKKERDDKRSKGAV